MSGEREIWAVVFSGLVDKSDESSASFGVCTEDYAPKSGSPPVDKFYGYMDRGPDVSVSVYQSGKFLSKGRGTIGSVRLSDVTSRPSDGDTPNSFPLATELSRWMKDYRWSSARATIYRAYTSSSEPSWAEFSQRGVREVLSDPPEYEDGVATVELADVAKSFDVPMGRSKYRGYGQAVRSWNLGDGSYFTVTISGFPFPGTGAYPATYNFYQDTEALGLQPTVIPLECAIEFRARMYEDDGGALFVGEPATFYGRALLGLNKSTRELEFRWNQALAVRTATTTGGKVPVSHLTDGLFHHYAGVRDATNIYFYIDGALVQTVAHGFSPPDTLGSLWTVGGIALDFSTCSQGDFDEVRLWRNIRSSDDIAANYDKVLTGKEPGLRALWQFSSGYGPVARESCSLYGEPNLNDITFGGMLPAKLGHGALSIGAPAELIPYTSWDYVSQDAFSVRLSFIWSGDSSGMTIAMDPESIRLFVTSSAGGYRIVGYAYIGGVWVSVQSAVGLDGSDAAGVLGPGIPIYVELTWDGNDLVLYHTDSVDDGFGNFVEWKISSVSNTGVTGTLGQDPTYSAYGGWVMNYDAISSWVYEFGIFNAARSAADVAADWQGWLDPSEPNLLSYYRFEETTPRKDDTGLQDIPDVVHSSHCYGGLSLSLRSMTWVSTYDGDEGIAGKYKPRAGGFKPGVEPVLVDSIAQIYQFHDGSSKAVRIRRSGGVSSQILVDEVQALSTSKGQLTGTFSVSAASTALVGVGTRMKSELVPNEAILVGGEVAVVRSITDDENAVLWNENMSAHSSVTVYRDRPLIDECLVDVARGYFRFGVAPFGVVDCDVWGENVETPNGAYTDNPALLIAWVALDEGYMLESEIDKTSAGIGDWDASPTTGLVSSMEGRVTGFWTGLDGGNRGDLLTRLALSFGGVAWIKLDGKLSAKQLSPSGAPTRSLKTAEYSDSLSPMVRPISNPVSEIELRWYHREVALRSADITAVQHPSIEYFEALRDLTRNFKVIPRVNPNPKNGALPLVVESAVTDLSTALWLADLMEARHFDPSHIEEVNLHDHTNDEIADVLTAPDGRWLVVLGRNERPGRFSLVCWAEDWAHSGGIDTSMIDGS